MTNNRIAAAAAFTAFTLMTTAWSLADGPLDRVGTYHGPLDHVGQTNGPLVDQSTLQWKPQYSLELLGTHPYNSAGVRGHASSNPASPKWFAPGYGYQIPYADYRLNRYRSLSPYGAEYQFGIRTPGRRTTATHQYFSNSYGGPWYFPGSTTNTTRRGFRW